MSCASACARARPVASSHTVSASSMLSRVPPARSHTGVDRSTPLSNPGVEPARSDNCRPPICRLRADSSMACPIKAGSAEPTLASSGRARLVKTRLAGTASPSNSEKSSCPSIACTVPASTSSATIEEKTKPFSAASRCLKLPGSVPFRYTGRMYRKPGPRISS